MAYQRILNDDVLNQVKDIFKQLTNEVKVILFVSASAEEVSGITQQLLGEVCGASDKIHLEVFDVVNDNAIAKQYKVSGKAPAIVVAAKDGDVITDYGIRFLGVPSGHEFGTLIQDIVMVSSRESGLSEAAKTYIKSLASPLHLEVFVTPG